MKDFCIHLFFLFQIYENIRDSYLSGHLIPCSTGCVASSPLHVSAANISIELIWYRCQIKIKIVTKYCALITKNKEVKSSIDFSCCRSSNKKNIYKETLSILNLILPARSLNIIFKSLLLLYIFYSLVTITFDLKKTEKKDERQFEGEYRRQSVTELFALCHLFTFTMILVNAVFNAKSRSSISVAQQKCEQVFYSWSWSFEVFFFNFLSKP